MKKNGNRLINGADAARLANTTQATIAAWARKGWLPIAEELGRNKIGRPGRRYDAKEVERVAKERKTI